MAFSRRGQEIETRALRRTLARQQGHAPSLTGLSAQGVTVRDVADVTSLPAAGDEKALTTPAGNLIFLLDYSALDGGDVVG